MKKILAAQIISPHGIRGFVKIKSFFSPQSKLLDFVVYDNQNNKINIELQFANKKYLVCKLDIIRSRAEAEFKKKINLYILRDDLPKIGQGEFYVVDLEGLPVYDNQNKLIGKIKAMHNFSAGALAEIEFKNSEKSVIYPFTEEFFPTISENKVILNNKALI